MKKQVQSIFLITILLLSSSKNMTSDENRFTSLLETMQGLTSYSKYIIGSIASRFLINTGVKHLEKYTSKPDATSKEAQSVAPIINITMPEKATDTQTNRFSTTPPKHPRKQTQPMRSTVDARGNIQYLLPLQCSELVKELHQKSKQPDLLPITVEESTLSRTEIGILSLMSATTLQDVTTKCFCEKREKLEKIHEQFPEATTRNIIESSFLNWFFPQLVNQAVKIEDTKKRTAIIMIHDLTKITISPTFPATSGMQLDPTNISKLTASEMKRKRCSHLGVSPTFSQEELAAHHKNLTKQSASTYVSLFPHVDAKE